MNLQVPALLRAAVILSLLFAGSPVVIVVSAQTTAFTYQGRLTDQGTPASGSYDFTFALFDAASGGTIVAGPATNSSVAVTSGAFSVSLDFGQSFPGTDRWIELGVRAHDTASFTTLTPRQKITSTPYAITAGTLATPITAAQTGSLTNHDDVSVANLIAGQILIYNGSFWTNAALPSAGNNGTNPAPVTLAYSGTNVPVNAAAGTHFRLVVTNNFLLQNPTGATDGQRLLFELIQDGVGGRTMALGNAFRLGLDLPVINLTTNANGRDFITCLASGTNFYVTGFIKGF